MKRSTDNRRSPAEIKIDLQRHYGGMEENAPDQKAAERFHRKPYTGIQSVNRRHGAWIEDADKYIAEKYNIRGNNDDKSSEISNTDILDT